MGQRYFCEQCNGNFLAVHKLLVESLDACTVTIICSFFRRTHCYMSVYSQGATGLLAEFAVKKFRSHRGVSEVDLATAKKEKDIKDASYISARKGKARV